MKEVATTEVVASRILGYPKHEMLCTWAVGDDVRSPSLPFAVASMDEATAPAHTGSRPRRGASIIVLEAERASAAAVAAAASRGLALHRCRRGALDSALENTGPAAAAQTSGHARRTARGAEGNADAALERGAEVRSQSDILLHRRGARNHPGHRRSCEVMAERACEGTLVHAAFEGTSVGACEGTQVGAIRRAHRPPASSGIASTGCRARQPDSGSRNGHWAVQNAVAGAGNKTTGRAGCMGIAGWPWWVRDVNVRKVEF